MRSQQAPQHEIARGREIGVEVHGGHDRLERVGQDRLLGPAAGRVLALAEQQMRPEVDLLRDLGEHARVHDAGAHLRQVTFGQLREVLEHVVRHDEPEHRVAEELEPFVRRRPVVLRAPRSVRERAEQQRTVGEVHAERRLERVETFGNAGGRHRLRRRAGHDRACLRRVGDCGSSSPAATQSIASRTVRHSATSSSSIAKPDHALAELRLHRFHELEQRVVVGVEVVAQARVGPDRVGLDLEDLRELLAHDALELAAVDGAAMAVRLGRHRYSRPGQISAPRP